MSKTLEVIEENLDTIEETLDAIERIPTARFNGTTKRQQIIIMTVTAAVSAAAGAVVAYKVSQKRLRSHYEQIAETEIAEARQFFAGNKEGVFSDPISARDALIPKSERSVVVESASSAVEEYSAGVIPQSEKDRLLAQESMRTPYHEMYKGDISLEEADEIIENDPNANVQEVTDRIKFPSTPAEEDNFDYESEVVKRTMETPYVITHDEYYQGERDFEQQSVTWYNGDSVLVDNHDEPIDDVESMVGLANMSRFGHGSKDENIVYVRNERYDIDFEVAFSGGTYTNEVLGLDPPG